MREPRLPIFCVFFACGYDIRRSRDVKLGPFSPAPRGGRAAAVGQSRVCVSRSALHDCSPVTHDRPFITCLLFFTAGAILSGSCLVRTFFFFLASPFLLPLLALLAWLLSTCSIKASELPRSKSDRPRTARSARAPFPTLVLNSARPVYREHLSIYTGEPIRIAHHNNVCRQLLLCIQCMLLL